jgi:hypothetical protein
LGAGGASVQDPPSGTDNLAPDFFSDAAAPDDEDDYVPPSDDELDAGALYVPDATAPTVVAAEITGNGNAPGEAGGVLDEASEPVVDDGPSLFDEELVMPPVPASGATPAPAVPAPLPEAARSRRRHCLMNPRRHRLRRRPMHPQPSRSTPFFKHGRAF